MSHFAARSAMVATLGLALLLPYVASAEVAPQAPQGIKTTEVHAETYGVKGDGVTDDTIALQAAIDATAKRHATLVLKPGVYLTGSLFLKSGMALRLDKDVRLVGVQTLAGYPRRPSRIAGIEMTWPSALINVYEQNDVKIYGEGVIDGNGKVFWNSYWDLRKDYTPKGLRWASDYDAERPRLIQVFNSSRVELGQGLMLTRSGFWTVQVVYSHDIKVSGITIRNNVDGKGPSTDGIDIDSSHDILVENADIDCNDDDIVLKAGRDSDGLRVNRPTERVLVRNSIIRSGSAGIAIGSETSGGVRDVEVYGLTVVGPTQNGILLKSAHTRGGTVTHINIHDIDVRGVTTVIRVDLNWNPAYSYATIPDGMTDVPPVWRILATPVPHDQGLPHYRDIRISNVKAVDTKMAMRFDAYPDAPAEAFQLDNIDIAADTAGSITHARGIHFTLTKITAADGKPVVLDDATDITGLQ